MRDKGFTMWIKTTLQCITNTWRVAVWRELITFFDVVYLLNLMEQRKNPPIGLISPFFFKWNIFIEIITPLWMRRCLKMLPMLVFHFFLNQICNFNKLLFVKTKFELLSRLGLMSITMNDNKLKCEVGHHKPSNVWWVW